MPTRLLRWKFNRWILLSVVLLCVLYYLDSLFAILKDEPSEDHSKNVPTRPPTRTYVGNSKIPVYYINLEQSRARRNNTEGMLNSLGYPFRRVSAWTEAHVMRYVRVDKRHWHPKEIGCIASHLQAMMQAVEHSRAHPEAPPYALIIEDDISLEFNVDFRQLVNDAPPDFKIIQLGSSNYKQMRELWWTFFNSTTGADDPSKGNNLRGQLSLHRYAAGPSNLFSLRAWNSSLWSTQGYLINTKRIAEEISRYVTKDPETREPRIKLPDPVKFTRNCQAPYVHQVDGHTAARFCQRVVADVFLYNLFRPTYIFHLPLVNGASKNPAILSEDSTIQHEVVASIQNQQAFHHLASLVDLICDSQASYRRALPVYIRCFDSADSRREHYMESQVTSLPITKSKGVSGQLVLYTKLPPKPRHPLPGPAKSAPQSPPAASVPAVL